MEPAGFSDTAEVAFTIHEALDSVGLVNALKTSGGKGLQIIVPLKPVYNSKIVMQFVRSLGKLIESLMPEKVFVENIAAERKKGKVHIDYLQNASGKVVAAPFSVKPLPMAPVSFPLILSRLKINLNPKLFNLRNATEKIEREGNPLKDFFRPQTLEKAFRTLGVERS